MDIDLQRLEKKNQPTIKQETYIGKPLPIIDVKWGAWSHPVIDVQISGINKGLLKLRQEDDSYSKRPASLIKDIDKLMAISNKTF